MYSCLIVILLFAVSNGANNKTDPTAKANNKVNNIRKIIIDSAGGVNDAFALIWALDAFNNKLLKVEALTTVQTDLTPYDAFRNVIHMVNITKRSKMRKKILSIPIAKPPGTTDDDAINNNINDDVDDELESVDDGLFGFSEIFTNYPDILSSKKKTLQAYKTASYADDLLVDTILKNPNEISLIATGPLTNLYLAELKHPGILSLTKDIYILGGEFLNKTGNCNAKNYALSEFNFNYDSQALFHIFSHSTLGLPNIFVFPLDVTTKLRFGLHDISLLYTLLNNDIQTEIEMCRMKMEKDADKFSGEDDEYDESDLYESDRVNKDDDYDDEFHCTQTGLLYIFYEKMMEETLRKNYLNGFSDSLLIEDASIIGYLLYPHLFEFKYVNCKVNGENGMVWYDDSLHLITNETMTIPNCFVNLEVDVEKLIHGFTRDSVHMMHWLYLDYMEYMMNQMDW